MTLVTASKSARATVVRELKGLRIGRGGAERAANCAGCGCSCDGCGMIAVRQGESCRVPAGAGRDRAD